MVAKAHSLVSKNDATLFTDRALINTGDVLGDIEDTALTDLFKPINNESKVEEILLPIK